MKRIILFCLALLLAAGCAKVAPEADFGKVTDVVNAREGQRPLWNATPADEAFIRSEVAAILARGVSPRDAVRLALLNSPAVQARFEEVGMARADVVQAGLPQNPSLAALFGFPLFSGGPLAALAAQAMVSISDLAEIKDRTAKAKAELERDILIVGHDACVAAREAKLAWLELAYATRAAALASEVKRRSEALAATARRYKDFGLADTGKAAALESAAASAALEVASLASKRAVAKARLARLMGLEAGAAFEIAGEAPAAPATLPETAAALAYAKANNLEVQAAAYAVEAARSGRELEKVRWLKDFEVGAGYDYDIEGNRTLGPGFSLKLPLFDQNQAQRAKAEYRLRQAVRLLEEARLAAGEKALRALEDASLAKSRAGGLAAGVIPPAERAAAWAKKYAGAMQLPETAALEAELTLLRARLEHNQALLEESQALVRLEYALGGPLR